MITIYFGMNLFGVPPEHTAMMNELRHRIEKEKSCVIAGEILIPVTGEFSSTLWYNKQTYESFRYNAHVLIVDTTHIPRIHQKTKNVLRDHKILLVECRKAHTPRSCIELNPPETKEYVLNLEYKESIIDMWSHIFTKMCVHHANLNLTQK